MRKTAYTAIVLAALLTGCALFDTGIDPEMKTAFVGALAAAPAAAAGSIPGWLQVLSGVAVLTAGAIGGPAAIKKVKKVMGKP